MSGPCATYIPGSGAYEFVDKEYQAYSDRVRDLSSRAAVDIEALESFTPNFAGQQWQVDTSAVSGIVVPDLSVDANNRPQYIAPTLTFESLPPTAPLLNALDDGEGIRDVGDIPQEDYGDFTLRTIQAPILNYPDAPGPAPEIVPGDVPSAPVLGVIDDPTLQQVGQIGAVPELTLDRVPEIPGFAPPEDALQDVYFSDHLQKTGELDDRIHEFAHQDTGLADLRPAFARVIDAINTQNTGLPEDVQQQIFDAGRERLREDQLASERSAERQWAERGFELPGAAIAAAVVEARRTRQVEAGRLNRELTVETHRQAIDNMRYVIDRAVQYEGQLMNTYLQLDDNARQLAFQHFEVMRGIYNAYVAIHELNIRAFTAEIAVYEANVRVELSKLEAYRTELEAIRVQSEINEQEVNVYEARIRAQQAQVDIYNGQITAYRGLIDSELSKVQAFSAKVDAYTAEISGVAERVNVFEAEVRGEEARARAYGTQVEAFRARVGAWESQVRAEATRTSSINDVVQAQASIYNSNVEAWAAGTRADTQRVESSVSRHRANIEAYLAELQNEETSARMRALGFDKDLEQARIVLATQVANIDRALTNVRTASELELSKLDTAARVNAQLAAASMASLNLSATLSGSDSWSASSSSACSTNYQGTI